MARAGPRCLPLTQGGLGPHSPKDAGFKAKSSTSGTSERNSVGTLPTFWQGCCLAGCSLLGEEVGWAPWPPLPQQQWDVLTPGNCPRSPFGGAALPSADLCWELGTALLENQMGLIMGRQTATDPAGDAHSAVPARRAAAAVGGLGMTARGCTLPQGGSRHLSQQHHAGCRAARLGPASFQV